jgi:hypothetical protein
VFLAHASRGSQGACCPLVTPLDTSFPCLPTPAAVTLCTLRRRWSMAKVIRFGAGGGFVVEAFGLAMGEAKELAARLTEAGDPPGCSWCVGLEEEDEDLSSDEAG